MGALCGKETETHVLQLSGRPGVHELGLGLGAVARWLGLLRDGIDGILGQNKFVAARLIFNICRGKQPFGLQNSSKFMNPSLTILIHLDTF